MEKKDTVSQESRIAAVRELEAMALPVGEPNQMKRESTPVWPDSFDSLAIVGSLWGEPQK